MKKEKKKKCSPARRGVGEARLASPATQLAIDPQRPKSKETAAICVTCQYLFFFCSLREIICQKIFKYCIFVRAELSDHLHLLAGVIISAVPLSCIFIRPDSDHFLALSVTD